MNYSNICFLLNSLKLERGLRQTLCIPHSPASYKMQESHVNGSQRYFCIIQKLRRAENNGDSLLLSPQEVTKKLRQNEYNKEFSYGSIKSFDSNQLASNNPIEDTKCEAQCLLTPGFLVGIFDGHGGPACAQVLSKRMLNYIAASLLPEHVLNNLREQKKIEKLITIFNNKADIVPDLKTIYNVSFMKYLDNLAILKKKDVDIKTCLEMSILHLDKDLSNEVVEPYMANGVINRKTLKIALSGAVACIAYIDGPHLYIANVGDCNAVLGTMTEDNQWKSKKITKEHDTENIDELKRILNEHPVSERNTIFKRDRLLGELVPLRSLGDFRYKWSADNLRNLAGPFDGPNAIPKDYHTPPYLTAKPDIFYHRLTPKDKFLIIASDGIWDNMTPLQSVKLVGEHMKGKVFFNNLKLPKKNITLEDINQLMLQRKKGLKCNPIDRNAATHLIRYAIGGTECGVDHNRLVHSLNLPPDVSRMFRDDMTVTVIYFDSEYLRQCPA